MANKNTCGKKKTNTQMINTGRNSCVCAHASFGQPKCSFEASFKCDERISNANMSRLRVIEAGRKKNARLYRAGQFRVILLLMLFQMLRSSNASFIV